MMLGMEMFFFTSRTLPHIIVELKHVAIRLMYVDVRYQVDLIS